MAQAPYACVPCRTLKRKCTRELPMCYLCKQLKKICDYPTPARARGARSENVTFLSQRLERLEQRLENGFSHTANHQSEDDNHSYSQTIPSLSQDWTNFPRVEFPATYFLDAEAYHQMHADQLNPAMAVPVEVLQVLQSKDTIHSMCLSYMAEIQCWIPMLSKKRLLEKVNNFNESTHAGLALLLLSMKLTLEIPAEGEHSASASMYRLSRAFYSKRFNEMGHAIYPAAYLSISNAARLGIILGLHDRKHASQLFKEPETWTQREEERRTWWAIVILERYINQGISGLPLSTPEPLQGTLLPFSESHWAAGELGSNVPLFASSFNTTTEIGSFASICQASYILGLVIRHRNDCEHSHTDAHFRLAEAQRLHKILRSLNINITSSDDCVIVGVAAALCFTARLILYNIYACNEHYSPADVRIPEETEMQKASLEGLKEVVNGVYILAQYVSLIAKAEDAVMSASLLLTHCLYQASSELAWFIREENRVEEIVCLKVIVELLRSIQARWRVAGEYLKNLEADGSLAAISG